MANESFSISKYASAAAISGIHDIVNLIFDDFSAVGFLRDFAIGKILEFWLSKLSRVIVRLREKGKVVNGLTVLMEYHKQDGSIIFLKFHAEVDKFVLLIQEVNANLTYTFFESISAGKNVSITLDGDDQLNIKIV
jgi:hypothetical protein